MADEKLKADNNLQGNLGDSPEVDTINEGAPEEKVPTNEIRDWEKGLQTPNLTEVKSPGNTVEKTMDLIAEKGQEAGGSKKAAQATPERIQVNGFVYRRIEDAPAPYVRFHGAVYQLDE